MFIKEPTLKEINNIGQIVNDMPFSDNKFNAYEKFVIPLTNLIDIDSLAEDDYYILYFDILGYKDKLEQYGEEYFLKIICAVIDTIEAVYEEPTENFTLKKIQKNRHFGYHIFSDNIIIFMRKTHDIVLDAHVLMGLIKDAFIIQRNLMGQYRILIRGAITEGKLYYGGDFIYGSGLIKSYQMENYKAIYPRIIIDRNCIIELQKAKNEYIIVYSYLTIEQLINIDNDDEYFIGYINMFADNPYVFLQYLFYHKNLIESYLVNDLLSEKEEIKFIWCKEYHNIICKLYQLENFKIR